MTDHLRKLIASIDGIASATDTDQLQALERAMDDYFASPDASRHLDDWFRLFERFPDEDGYEMFWTILHGIEHQPGYEALVVESVARFPSRFPLLMVNRMLNGGMTHVGKVDLLNLLQSVAANDACLASARAEAKGFVEHQEEAAESDGAT
jgi:hypothetical protein